MWCNGSDVQYPMPIRNVSVRCCGGLTHILSLSLCVYVLMVVLCSATRCHAVLCCVTAVLCCAMLCCVTAMMLCRTVIGGRSE